MNRMGGVGVLGVGIVPGVGIVVITVLAVLGVGGRRPLGGVVVLRPAVGRGRVSPRVLEDSARGACRTRCASFRMSKPATRADPSVGERSVVSMSTVVDFPAPFGPRKP